MDLLKKIKAMVQWGRQSKSLDDSARDQIAQVESTGSKPFAVVYVYPYGMSANSPVECNVLQFNSGGSGKSKIGMPTMMENRFLNLKEWEVAIGNFKSKAHAKFDDDSNIRLNTSASDSEDWAVQFTEMKTAFDEIKSDFNDLVTQYNTLLSDFNSQTAATAAHTHSAGTIPVPDNAASMLPSTATGSSSAASMDGAKVEKVRLP